MSNPLATPDYYAPTEQKYGLPDGFLYAVAKQESTFNPAAVGPATKTGERAQGLMQFMPGTARRFGIDPHDPAQAVDAAGHYYQNLFKMFDGDPRKAIAGYNWGEGNVQRKGIENAPAETRDYFNKIYSTVAAHQAVKGTQVAENTAQNPNVPQTMNDAAPQQNTGSRPDFATALKQHEATLQGQQPQPGNPSDIAVSGTETGERPDFATALKQFTSNPENTQESNPAAIAGRNVLQGAASLVDLPQTLKAGITYGGDKLINGIGYAGQALMGRKSADMKQLIPDELTNKSVASTLSHTVRANVDPLLDKYFPSSVPRDKGDRLLADLAGGVGGGITGGGGLLRGAVAGGIGGLAAGATREAGGGVPAQIAAGLIGGGVPYAGQKLGQTVMGAGTQAKRDAMAANQAAFQGAGTTGTVGQTTDAWLPKTFEKYLSIAPGAAGVLAKKGEDQAAQIGNSVDNLVSGITGKATKEQAGREVNRAITEDFLPQKKIVQNKLYNALDAQMLPDTLVPVTNYSQMLTKLTAPIQGAEATSKKLVNPALVGFKSALAEDTAGTPAVAAVPPSYHPTLKDQYGNPAMTNPGSAAVAAGKPTGQLPYQAIKELRTKIGQELESPDLISDIKTAQYKQLYGALSEDMKAAATAQSPEALAAFNRANNFTKALHARADVLQNVIDNNGGGEQIFNAALSGTKDGASTLRTVMKSLPSDDSKAALAGAVVKQMGKAIASKQDATGNVFSMQTFLTNYSKLSPEAKTALFSPIKGTFKDDIEKVAKAASLNRDYQSVFANSSGTAATSANIASWLGLAHAVSTLNVPLLAAGAGGIASNYGLAKAMTSPAFIRWLAVSVKRPNELLPVAIDRLEKTAKQQKDDDALQAAQTMKANLKGQTQ